MTVHFLDDVKLDPDDFVFGVNFHEKKAYVTFVGGLETIVLHATNWVFVVEDQKLRLLHIGKGRSYPITTQDLFFAGTDITPKIGALFLKASENNA